MARSLVERLGNNCGAAAALAERLAAGMTTLARGESVGGLGPGSVARAANDFVDRGWLLEDAAGWRRTPEPLPAGLASFLAGADAMSSACAARVEAAATAVVTLPAAQSAIANALPAQGPIHASLERTEEILDGLARAAVASFTVMSPFVNHEGALFAMRLFEDCRAPSRTLITRRSGTTRVVLDQLLPTFREMGVRVLNYLLPTGGGYETFHAKVVLADADQAYVGSANMTRYARHSMELGVVLAGRQARAVAAIVRAVESISTPVVMR